VISFIILLAVSDVIFHKFHKFHKGV